VAIRSLLLDDEDLRVFWQLGEKQAKRQVKKDARTGLAQAWGDLMQVERLRYEVLKEEDENVPEHHKLSGPRNYSGGCEGGKYLDVVYKFEPSTAGLQASQSAAS